MSEYIWQDKNITNEYPNKFTHEKTTNIWMSIFVQNIQMYLNIRLFSQDYFGVFWPSSYVVLFCTHIEPFWTNNKKIVTIFEKQWKFKYIRYHRYWTNEYPNIFFSINRWKMNIRTYSPWKKLTNIWTDEYIRLNIFKYIRISEYSSHTGPEVSNPSIRVVSG